MKTQRQHLPVTPTTTPDQELFKLLFNNSGGAILLTIPDGSIIAANSSKMRTCWSIWLDRSLKGKGTPCWLPGTGEGLTIYEKNRQKIDVVISDMGLPKFGGYELFQSIKAINPNVRVIFASGYIEPGTKEKILNEGVKQFIQKPYDLNEVLRAVRDALQ